MSTSKRNHVEPNPTAPEVEIDLAKMRAHTRPYDAARYLKTNKEMAAYLEEALAGGDPRLVAVALGNIARAKGMADIARKTGLGRESLYKALSSEGNPGMATFLAVVRALGLQLHASSAA